MAKQKKKEAVTPRDGQPAETRDNNKNQKNTQQKKAKSQPRDTVKKSQNSGRNQNRNGAKSTRSSKGRTANAPVEKSAAKVPKPPKAESVRQTGNRKSQPSRRIPKAEPAPRGLVGMVSQVKETFRMSKPDPKPAPRAEKKGGKRPAHNNLPTGKLKIIPLGGLNEIGKNMTVVEYENDIIIVDCRRKGRPPHQ